MSTKKKLIIDFFQNRIKEEMNLFLLYTYSFFCALNIVYDLMAYNKSYYRPVFNVHKYFY